MRDPFVMFCAGAVWAATIAALHFGGAPTGLVTAIVLATWAPIAIYYHVHPRRVYQEDE